MKEQTIVQTIESFSQKSPDRLFTRIVRRGLPDVNLTYRELLSGAGSIAHFFESAGVKKGEVVVLILPHGPELVESFVGALLLGAIPSIFAVPSPKITKDLYQKTLAQILEVCDTRFVITDGIIKKDLVSPIGKTMVVLDVADREKFSSEFKIPNLLAADIAFLQHSSGTTGLKKGVALSHRSVLNQIAHYRNAIRLVESDRIVSWLPLYHDMGLIACFILPLISGVSVTLLSPFEWVADPVTLFRAITDDKGTLCWQPNFAYAFLSNNIEDDQLKNIRLDSMRSFINCAEPVSVKNHALFSERFQKIGLKKEMLATCYAMAENTFAVTQGGILEPVMIEEINWDEFTRHQKAVIASSDTKFKRALVSSGKEVEGTDIRIVDDHRQELGVRSVGEIAIKSDSMLTEYFHRPDLTKNALVDGWYFTGDMGYVNENGFAFVTGRKKDMIIVAGKNIYPQDIEELVSAIDGIHPGRVVALGLFNEETGTEDVVVLAETTASDPSDHMRIKLVIAKAIREELECVANDIMLLPHMWLLKSSSGKIARNANKEKYLKTKEG